jgi:hypothetical protein
MDQRGIRAPIGNSRLLPIYPSRPGNHSSRATVGSEWVVMRWIPDFSSLNLGYAEYYAPHSITPYTTVQPKTMQYIHDLSDTKLFLRTVSWFFTSY